MLLGRNHQIAAACLRGVFVKPVFRPSKGRGRKLLLPGHPTLKASYQDSEVDKKYPGSRACRIVDESTTEVGERSNFSLVFAT